MHKKTIFVGQKINELFIRRAQVYKIKIKLICYEIAQHKTKINMDSII